MEHSWVVILWGSQLDGQIMQPIRRGVGYWMLRVICLNVCTIIIFVFFICVYVYRWGKRIIQWGPKFPMKKFGSSPIFRTCILYLAKGRNRKCFFSYLILQNYTINMNYFCQGNTLKYLPAVVWQIVFTGKVARQIDFRTRTSGTEHF